MWEKRRVNIRHTVHTVCLALETGLKMNADVASCSLDVYIGNYLVNTFTILTS